MHRLVTIGVSHFCEKARWALDRAGLPYRESAHLPVFHLFETKRRGGGTSVPKLVISSGPTLHDSAEILQWVDAQLPEAERLYPSDDSARAEVDALEDRFNDVLGPATRVVAYGLLLPVMGRAAPHTAMGAPRWERVAVRAAMPIAKRILKKTYGLTPDNIARAEGHVDEIFGEVSERLSDGRAYLTGERFTAADLTFVALAGPALNRYRGGEIVPEDVGPDTLGQLVERWKATPAGRWALGVLDRQVRPGAGSA